MTYTAPSKTFLIGEYAVLAGSPALVACTAPWFELRPATDATSIHPLSPAGRFLSDHQYKLTECAFVDPHQGQGGFGASSAQFLLCYQYHHHIQQWDATSYQALLDCYCEYATQQGTPPSGADVLAQTDAGLAWVDVTSASVKHHPWPFHDCAVTLARTGHKVATHHHLAALGRQDFSRLTAIAQQAQQAFSTATTTDFITAIDDYRQTLASLSLTLDHSVDCCRELYKNPHVVAAKGCGALGADVIAVLHTPEEYAAIDANLLALGLTPVVTLSHQDSVGTASLSHIAISKDAAS